MTETKPKSNAGRHSKYRAEFAVQAFKICRLGATNEELADFFEVGTTTLERWAKAHPEFRGALKQGKLLADADVMSALFQRAVGYDFDAEKVLVVGGKPIRAKFKQHVPADVTACIFWLKNRRPAEWRAKPEPEVEGRFEIDGFEVVVYEDEEPTPPISAQRSTKSTH